MPDRSSWRALEAKDGLPQLLVNTTFDEAGYEVQLTDLSKIWGEALEKSAIIDRAGTLGCSIDPSEDDQYDILLDKIDSALRGDEGTTFEIQAQGETINLVLSAPMPDSLPTFTWSIELVRKQDSAVANGLVIPLFVQATQLRDQMQQLIHELAAKDRVIAKIADRLELSGNDLTAVFPGVSNLKTSRNKSQRAQLANHVKGLGDFDEAAWRASAEQSAALVSLTSDMLTSVLNTLPVAESHANREVPTNDWWAVLPDATILGATRTPSVNGKAKELQVQRRGITARGKRSSTNEDSTDDEFQRQRTPPQLQKPRQSPTGDQVEPDNDTVPTSLHESASRPEDEETDDDDLDAKPSAASSSQTKGRSQQQEESTTSRAQPAPSRKLGVVGGRKSKSPRPEPEPVAEPHADGVQEEVASPKPRSRGKLGAFGGKKAPSPAPELPEESTPPPPKPRARLGAFGGRSKPADEPLETRDTAHSPSKPMAKVGTFGGKNKLSTVADSAEPRRDHEGLAKPNLGSIGGTTSSRESSFALQEPKAERASHTPEKTAEEEQQEREGSQERADKKRERLKRELEEKSKVPVKKKRKF